MEYPHVSEIVKTFLFFNFYVTSGIISLSMRTCSALSFGHNGEILLPKKRRMPLLRDILSVAKEELATVFYLLPLDETSRSIHGCENRQPIQTTGFIPFSVFY
jgi:hypothetical protein